MPDAASFIGVRYRDSRATHGATSATEPEPPAMKKAAKKGKRQPAGMAEPATPVPVIFVGYAEPCLKEAARLELQNPVIVNCFAKMKGRHGPIEVHLCGNYEALPHWPAIRKRLHEISDSDKYIEVTLP